jgi:hypothetical protein
MMTSAILSLRLEVLLCNKLEKSDIIIYMPPKIEQELIKQYDKEVSKKGQMDLLHSIVSESDKEFFEGAAEGVEFIRNSQK